MNIKKIKAINEQAANLNKKQMEYFKKLMRRWCADELKHTHDPLKWSLVQEWRTIYIGDNDSGAEYTLIETDGDETDEEITEWVESPWDCTGEKFTTSLEWHRNPCGLISIVNHFNYDY